MGQLGQGGRQPATAGKVVAEHVDAGIAPRGRILVIDGDPRTRHLAREILEHEGFAVDEAQDAPNALSTIRGQALDAIILDIGLPDYDGFELLVLVRREIQVPIIVLTSRARVTDQVVALRLGADDYLLKPCSPDVFVARVQSALRRARAITSVRILDFGDLVIDLDERVVRRDGMIVECTPREFSLLAFLAENPRHAFSRRDLLTQVWGSSPEWQSPKTVTEHVRRLRTKLERDPTQPRWLLTCRGVGYRFTP